MELKDIIKLVKNRLILILVITLGVTALSAFISLSSLNPVYSAESTVIIDEPKIDSSLYTENGTIIKDINPFDLYQKQIRSYLDFAKSKIVFQHVITSLNLNMSIADLKDQVQIDVEGEAGLITILATTDDAKLSQNIASQFAKSFKNLTSELKQVDNVRIINEATPLDPAGNSKITFILKVFIGFFFGLMIGFGIALLLDYSNNRIKSKEDIEKLTHLPVLGLIPENENCELIRMNLEKDSMTTRAYKTLATNLEFSLKENNFHTLLFTSTNPDAEKSMLLANTAITIAQNNKKVLVLDCDLKTPSTHKTFGTENILGITNILLQGTNFEDCIKPTKSENLDLLTCGPLPLNSSELLGSNKFKSLLENLTKLYDLVIINSSPVVNSIDAQVLSSICDKTILITASGKTEKSELIDAVKLLKNNSSNLLGVVLKNVPSNISGKLIDTYFYDNNNEK